MSPDLPFSYVAQLLLEAGAFLAIAIVASGRLRGGSWAGLATIGGLVASVVPLVALVMWFEGRFLDSSGVLEFVYLTHARLGELVTWTRPVGAVLIAAAVVLLARGSARTTDRARSF